jgi:hypothetical protein
MRTETYVCSIEACENDQQEENNQRQTEAAAAAAAATCIAIRTLNPKP